MALLDVTAGRLVARGLFIRQWTLRNPSYDWLSCSTIGVRWQASFVLKSVMSDDKAVKAWEYWRESAEKLDYFLLGVAAALTAYIGQHPPAGPFGVNAAALEVSSVVLFALSSVAGVDRLRATVVGLAAQQVMLDASGSSGQLRTLLTTGRGTTMIDTRTGRTYSAAQAVAKIEHEDKRHAAAQKEWERWKRRGERAYKARDWLLIAGVLAYAAAKAWIAASAIR